MARTTYPPVTRNNIAASSLGIPVDRAAGLFPASTTGHLFSVIGGRVLVRAILGQCTVIMATPGNVKLVATPQTGTAVDLCAVVALTTNEVGTYLHITGTVGDAMIASTNGGAGKITCDVAVTGGTVAAPGYIDLSTSATDATGKMKWTVWYVPIDDGAYVIAT